MAPKYESTSVTNGGKKINVVTLEMGNVNLSMRSPFFIRSLSNQFMNVLPCCSRLFITIVPEWRGRLPHNPNPDKGLGSTIAWFYREFRPEGRFVALSF